VNKERVKAAYEEYDPRRRLLRWMYAQTKEHGCSKEKKNKTEPDN
jgi:hypothetical protein